MKFGVCVCLHSWESVDELGMLVPCSRTENDRGRVQGKAINPREWECVNGGELLCKNRT